MVPALPPELKVSFCTSSHKAPGLVCVDLGFCPGERTRRRICHTAVHGEHASLLCGRTHHSSSWDTAITGGYFVRPLCTPEEECSRGEGPGVEENSEGRGRSGEWPRRTAHTSSSELSGTWTSSTIGHLKAVKQAVQQAVERQWKVKERQ